MLIDGDSTSSPRSWGCLENEDCSANMPSEDDIIEIPEGIELLLDQSTPLLTALIVNGGKLIFDKESGRFLYLFDSLQIYSEKINTS